MRQPRPLPVGRQKVGWTPSTAERIASAATGDQTGAEENTCQRDSDPLGRLETADQGLYPTARTTRTQCAPPASGNRHPINRLQQQQCQGPHGGKSHVPKLERLYGLLPRLCLGADRSSVAESITEAHPEGGLWDVDHQRPASLGFFTPEGTYGAQHEQEKSRNRPGAPHLQS